MSSAHEYWKEKKKLKDHTVFADVDYAITTRELARMFKEAGVDFASLPKEDFDNPLGNQQEQQLSLQRQAVLWKQH